MTPGIARAVVGRRAGPGASATALARRARRDPYLLLALGLALAAALPALVGPGIVATRAGGDSPFLVQRVQQLSTVLRAGHFPARWMPDAAHGLGYPFFHFYAALPYYLASLLDMAGAGVLWGIKLTQGLGFLLAALAAYRLARELDAPPAGALLASAAYTFAPFHLVNVYVRGDSLSEFWAMALFPAILWALMRLGRGVTPGRVAALAASYGALALCHNISALLFSPLVGAWLLAAALQRRREAPPSRRQGWSGHVSQGPSHTLGTTEEDGASSRSAAVPAAGVPASPETRSRAMACRPTLGTTAGASPKRLLPLPVLRGRVGEGASSAAALGEPGGAVRLLLAGGGALLLGLLISAWFWAPALRDQPLVQLQDQTTGYFHYSGHFRAADLVQPRAIHDYAITGERDPFSAGLAQVAVAALGLVVLGVSAARRRRIDAMAAMVVLTAGVATWLITPSSTWVWDHLPLLPYAQFPWRLLSVQALGLALLTSYAPRALQGRGATVTALLLSIALAVAGLAGLRVDRLPLRAWDVTVDRLMAYESQGGNLGTTVRHEYLPATMVPRPYTSARQLGSEHARPLALSGALRRADLIARGPTHQAWDLDLEAPSLLAFHLTAFPGWRATVDGAPQPVESVYGLGLVGVRLDAGQHEVRLTFGATRFQRAVEWASAAGLVALLGLVLYSCRASRKSRRRALAVAGIAALATAWLVVAPQRQPVDIWEGPLVADWDRAPYLHHEPEGVWFGELGLVGYDYGALVPRAGHMIPVTLTWEGAAEGARARLELVSLTAHLFEPAPVWSTLETPIEPPWTSVGLPLPADLPPGEYTLRLTVLDEDGPVGPRTASGTGIGGLTLMPVHILMGRPADADAPALGSYGPSEQPPVVALVGAQARPAGEGLVEATLTWRCERQAPLNYYLSLRVLDADGAQIASRDLPPLLGGYPTSLWRPGEEITDRVLVPLPADAPSQEAYGLEVVLYDRMTLGGVGSVRVP